MLINKVLAIPKYKLPFDNGYTQINDSYVWLKYGADTLYISLEDKQELFYRLAPYTVLKYNDRYVVFDVNGHYSFNRTDISFIKEGLVKWYDPFMTIVKHNISKCKTKNHTIIHVGYIKSILNNPNDLAIVYLVNINDKKYVPPKNAKLMTVDELINLNRNFDSFGIEYINYLTGKKYKMKGR